MKFLYVQGMILPLPKSTQSARVAIKISDRNKMEPGSTEREVSISGIYGSVKLAEAMIAEKLNQSHARSQSRADDGGHEEDA
jgi:hypothetical protein